MDGTLVVLNPLMRKGSWEEKTKKDEQENRLLGVCVQHEIDHLNGLTIHDRENKTKPMVSQKEGWS